MHKFSSREVEIGNLCSIPGSVLICALERDNLAQASLVHEAFFLTLVQILLVLLS